MAARRRDRPQRRRDAHRVAEPLPGTRRWRAMGASMPSLRCATSSSRPAWFGCCSSRGRRAPDPAGGARGPPGAEPSARPRAAADRERRRPPPRPAHHRRARSWPTSSRCSSRWPAASRRKRSAGGEIPGTLPEVDGRIVGCLRERGETAPLAGDVLVDAALGDVVAPLMGVPGGRLRRPFVLAAGRRRACRRRTARPGRRPRRSESGPRSRDPR